MVIDDSKPNPSAVRSRLREWEDYNLAIRLQDREYDVHYDHNRTERRTVGNDTKHSKKEQIKEDETAKEMRRAVNRKIEETDEQIAQRLAMEWNSEEQRKIQEKLRQELIDEQLARRLAESADLGSPVSVYGTQQPTASSSSQIPPSDLLIDFSSPAASDSQYTVQPSFSGSLSSGGTAPRGVALPGLASTSTPPRPSPPQISSSYNLPPPSQLLQPDPVAESPVNWPPPPPSVFQSTQPTSSALPPPIQPTSLPPPSYVPQPLPTTELQPTVSVLPNSQIGLSSNNPFLADLMTSNTGVGYGSVLPPASVSVVPPLSSSSLPPSSYNANTNIGFRSEFGLPPPSALALGGTASQPQQQYHQQQYQ